jgi:hypothetical protein
MYVCKFYLSVFKTYIDNITSVYPMHEDVSYYYNDSNNYNVSEVSFGSSETICCLKTKYRSDVPYGLHIRTSFVLIKLNRGGKTYE